MLERLSPFVLIWFPIVLIAGVHMAKALAVGNAQHAFHCGAAIVAVSVVPVAEIATWLHDRKVK